MVHHSLILTLLSYGICIFGLIIGILLFVVASFMLKKYLKERNDDYVYCKVDPRSIVLAYVWSVILIILSVLSDLYLLQ